MAIQHFTLEYLLIALFAFLLSVTLTPLIRRGCQQRHVLDFPTLPRKIHAHPTPRLGGVAIYAGFFLPLFGVFFSNGPVATLFLAHLDVFLSLFATSTLIFAIGLYDDIRGATVWQKLLIQLLAGVLIYSLGFKIEIIAVPFLGTANLGIIGFPLTLLWFVGVTNAINFTDGVDGVACGVGFFSVSTIFILSLFLHHTLTAFFAAALAGGIFGFAIYNFAPASIFMGDSGSLFIGFVLAAISLQSSQKSSTAVVLLLPIVALGVPIADTLLAIIRRVGCGRSPFTADRDHIHHKLLRMGFSSRQVALILYVACCFLGVTALLMTSVNNQVLTLILAILSVMAIGGMKMLGYTGNIMEINTFAKQRIQQKKAFLRRQKTAQHILWKLETPNDISQLRKLMITYLEQLEFDLAEMRVSCSSELQAGLAAVSFSWISPRYEEAQRPHEHLWSVRFPLLLHETGIGELLVGCCRSSEVSSLEMFLFAEDLTRVLESAFAYLCSSTDS